MTHSHSGVAESTHRHADGSSHSHDHAHAVDPEVSQLGPSERGSVVLDIGGDKGSLMIHAPESLAGVEIEISPVGADDQRTHIAIRERRAPSGVRWAGIFPPLPEGRYTVWGVDGAARDVVEIVGGHVTQVDWR